MNEVFSSDQNSSDQPPKLASMAEQFLEFLLKGDRHSASEMILNAVDSGIAVKDIYMQVFQVSQHQVGVLWQNNKITVAQEHFCTAATQMIMSQLYPHIFRSEKIGHSLVSTCVGGELHEIGVRMVTDFFEMEGWDTYFLGANTPTKSIIATIESQQAEVVAISASMTFHVNATAQMIKEIQESEAGKSVQILVGGRPFNIAENLWKTVNADAYAPDAQKAIMTANELITN